MKIGDLVKVRRGFFMGGFMGLIISERESHYKHYRERQFSVRLIGNVPTSLKRKNYVVLYRPDRLTLIKSSSSQGQ